MFKQFILARKTVHILFFQFLAICVRKKENFYLTRKPNFREKCQKNYTQKLTSTRLSKPTDAALTAACSECDVSLEERARSWSSASLSDRARARSR